MSVAQVNEKQVLEALQHVPADRWKDVLSYLHSLQSVEEKSTQSEPIRTAAELAESSLVGLWAERCDLPDSPSLARQLRVQAEHREGTYNVARQ